MGDLRSPPSWRHKTRDEQDAYVEWIGADPLFTGKGIGSKLLAWAHDYCEREKHCTTICLDVVSKNIGAIRLYERKGYV